MPQNKTLVLRVGLACALAGTIASGVSGTGDQKLKPDAVVAKHLESIGSADVLMGIHSRTVFGAALVRRPVGMIPPVLPEADKRTEAANFLLASADGKIAMVMKFYDLEYPGEHFAFDGKSATVSFTRANKRSVLGEFLSAQSGLIEEGLLGGVLSTGWALLHSPESGFRLKYREVRIEKRRFHEITLTPKNKRHPHRIVICLLFEFDTFRHVMTEYALVGKDESLSPPRYVEKFGRLTKQPPPETPPPRMVEKFGDFRSVDGLTLPFAYTIECPPSSVMGTSYTLDIRQVRHNGPIDPLLFKAE